MVARVSPALRLSVFYATLFGLVGIHLPFWPVWLAGRGLDSFEIGVVTAVGLAVRAVSLPAIGGIADRARDRRWIMVAAALMALLAAGMFHIAHGFVGIVLATVVLTIGHGALGPLTENLAMLLASARGFSYGRVRSLGSIAFILMALGGGW